MKTNFLTAIVTIGFLAAAFDSSAKDGIKTYSVPKDHPPTTKKSDNLTAVDVNSTPIQWKTPAGWKELAPTSIRIGNFLVTGKGDKNAEVAITSFPGSVGTELDNVNRWRGEIGLPPSQKISAEGIKINSSEAKLYDLTGATARTIVAVLPRDGASWFFKMRGDKGLVAETKPAFLEFLKSIRFSENAAERKAPAVLAAIADNPHGNITPASDPHAGLDFARAGDPHAGLAPAASQPANDEPKWNIPPSWKEEPQGAMVVKSFSISNKERNAAVAISVFPGDVGGDFANFNRWRGQMGLAPLSQNEFAKATQSIEVIGGKALLADMNGTDAKTGKPARLIAAIVPHAGSTWFYKLLGDERVVASEKDNFVKFVQTVRYP